jgi:hypothetical protein
MKVHQISNDILVMTKGSQSQWPRGLRRRSAAARMLRLWVLIPLGHGCLSVVSVECCQVEASATSWSLVQRSRTGEWGGHDPLWAVAPKTKQWQKQNPLLRHLDTICLTRNTVKYISVDWCWFDSFMKKMTTTRGGNKSIKTRKTLANFWYRIFFYLLLKNKKNKIYVQNYNFTCFIRAWKFNKRSGCLLFYFTITWCTLVTSQFQRQQLKGIIGLCLPFSESVN